MIIYDKKLFGWNLIARVHGSAVYRSVLPGLLSVACLILFRKVYREGYMASHLTIETREDEDIQHPYAIGMLIASTTFLIVFRANQGYARYWEATTATHHFMSKWMDSTIHTAVFHMQCEHYNHIKPPSYFDHPHLDAMFLTRARERVVTNSTTSAVVKAANESTGSTSTGSGRRAALTRTGSTRAAQTNQNSNLIKKRAVGKSIEMVKHESIRQLTKKHDLVDMDDNHPLKRKKPKRFMESFLSNRDGDDGTYPKPLQGPGRLDGNWGLLFPDQKATYFNRADHGGDHLFECSNSMELPSFASIQGGRTPPLFLQELSHLSSLLVAVALATLRNDMDGSMSPLGVYVPGDPWPEVDSDQIKDLNIVGSQWYHKAWELFLYLMGAGKSAKQRTRYNAMRPLPVFGGVSDNEILFLQMARGPSAKTQLCWNWLSEFIMREHLAGSLGKVGPPIVSRIIQFLSDGMIFYNHARKIMFVPFPFPHAQLSAVFVLLTIPAIAFLMEQYAENLVVGSLLTFFSVVCLSGIHEVARELENPFRNVPNELPLVTFMAHYNESLITMFSGYHPDHFWEDPEPPKKDPVVPEKDADNKKGQEGKDNNAANNNNQSDNKNKSRNTNSEANDHRTEEETKSKDLSSFKLSKNESPTRSPPKLILLDEKKEDQHWDPKFSYSEEDKHQHVRDVGENNKNNHQNPVEEENGNDHHDLDRGDEQDPDKFFSFSGDGHEDELVQNVGKNESNHQNPDKEGNGNDHRVHDHEDGQDSNKENDNDCDDNEVDDDDDDDQILYLQKKMEEFTKELERLKVKRRRRKIKKNV